MTSLQTHHTFALNAHCPNIQTIDSVDSLVLFLKQQNVASGKAGYWVLGEGSNTVFVEDIEQIIVLNRIKGIDVSESDIAFHLCVGAGENWHDLVKYCVDRNMGGFENLALIPGTVGAAPIQNIGAYGVEVDRFIEKVEFIDTDTQRISTLSREECQFGYRDSSFKQETSNQQASKKIITRVFFTLPKKYDLCLNYGPLATLTKPNAQTIFDAVVEIRQKKLPDVKVLGNAGSFFKNPVIDTQVYEQLKKQYPDMPHYFLNENQVKVPAAWLIDFLGFKGKRIGDIACHKNQALVLVNLGQGTGEDLLAMARQIRDRVVSVFGIILENEVRLINKDGLITL